MNGRNLYLSDPKHRFTPFYHEGSYGGLYLTLSVPWRKEHLPPTVVWGPVYGGPEPPPGRSHRELCEALTVYLRDGDDGRIYEARMMPSWEDADDENWEAFGDPTYLSHYFYGSHYCMCNRKLNAAEKGAVTDDVCDGTRFLIERIVCPKLPDLILASETLDLMTLEEILSGHKEYEE